MTYPQNPEQYPGSAPGGMPAQYGPGPSMPPAPMSPYPGGIDPVTSKPSGGTAITAAILALLGAVWAIIAGLEDFNDFNALDGTQFAWVVKMQAIVFALELITLAPGAILLFMRRPAGRWLIAVGSAAHIIQGIVAVVGIEGSGAIGSTQLSGEAVGSSVVGLLVVLIPAIATLVLVLVPLTGRWCAWRTGRPAQHDTYGGMTPGMGQPPQQW